MKNTLVVLVVCLFGCSASGEVAPAVPAADQEPSAHAKAHATVVLEGAGRCVGRHCTLFLATEPSGDSATFSTARCAEDACPAWQGTLTAAAQARVRSLAEQLQGQTLAEVYDCPGCADGPIHELVVYGTDGTASRHTLDPVAPTDVPPALLEASRLLQQLSSTLYTCEPSDLLVPDADCRATMEAETKRPLGVP